MKSLSLRKSGIVCLTFVLLCLCAPNAWAQDGFKPTDPTLNTPREYEIQEVKIEGNESAREAYILQTSSLRQGEKIVIPGEDISNGIQRLFRSGLFSDVQVLIAERTATGVRLVIKVTEQPKLLRYELKGIKRSQRRDLEDLIRFVRGEAVTDGKINQAINTINRFYREKGLWNTEVKVQRQPVADNEDQVVVRFDIEPGKKFEVKKIEFFGNEFFSDKTLKKNLKPLKEDKRFKFLSKKLFKQADFEEGQEKLITFYQKNGFRDARVVSDSVYLYNYQGDKTGVKVNVNVYEGPQYRVRNISWEGNTVYTDDQLQSALDFEKGDIFDEERFESNISFSPDGSDVNSLYKNVGYLFSVIIPNITVVEGDSVDIHFEISEDEIATIKQVTFSGNTKTHDDVVRRTLRTLPGRTYSQQDIIRTIRELSTLGFFNPENIVPSPIPNPQDRTVDIDYALEESQSTDNFEFSGGFGGRGIGIILAARVNFNNFSLRRMFEKGGWNPIPSGDGQRLSLGVQVTGRGFQSYSLGFTEPWLAGRPTSLGVNFSYNLLNDNLTNQKNKLFSASVSLGKLLRWPDDFFSTRGTLSYQLFDIAGGALFLAEGQSSILSYKQELERNTLDNFISPNVGSKFTISGEIAPPIKGFAEFYKLRSAYQYHVPLVSRLVFSTAAEFGYIGFLTGDRRSEFLRFFVGGTQLQQRQSFLQDNVDLRGFPGGNNGSISPRLDGEAVGGTIFSKYSFELRFPAVSNQQLQLIPYSFFDAGNAYLDFKTFDPFNVKRAVGFGSRVFLPILGLIDLSYGYRLDGIPGTSVQSGRWEFLFNIGAPF